MCTRTMFVADDGRVVTGRNMDWGEDMGTDLWAFGAGLERIGENGPSAFRWTSQHSSVIAAGYNCGTTDGINDAGLVANLLYLAESDFGTPGDRPILSVGAWTQYVLDQCATVAEAVEMMQTAPFDMTAPALPNNKKSGLHLSLSDASGDSAILEFIGGALAVHHSGDHRVMTNSPVYEQQLAINAYWKEIGGDVMLPGTSRAADRFVRASFHLGNLPTEVDARTAAAGVFSVQRNASKPLGASSPDRPELSKTLWTTVSDSMAGRYFFQDTLTPDVFWVDLDQLDFANSPRSRRLDLQGHPIVSGEASARFETAEPFAFLGSPPVTG